MKEVNGCDKDVPEGRWVIGRYNLRRCPLKEVTAEGIEYLEAYRFYKNGVLPMAGGWMDQTQGFIEAMGVIEQVTSEIEKRGQRK